MAHVNLVSPVAGDRLRILIAEDEYLIALELEMLVSEMGHEVVGHAATGPEAISLAEQARPDLVLMDLHLGQQTSGADAARRIRSSLGSAVAIISGSLRELEPSHLSEINPIAMLDKPFRDCDLKHVIDLAQQERCCRAAT